LKVAGFFCHFCSFFSLFVAHCKAASEASPKHNTPRVTNTLLGGEVIVQVIDPAHPLYGKTFPLLSISGNFSRRIVYMQFKDDLVLKVPLHSTNLSCNYFPASCKISLLAVQELVSLFQDANSNASGSQTHLGSTTQKSPNTIAQQPFTSLPGDIS